MRRGFRGAKGDGATLRAAGPGIRGRTAARPDRPLPAGGRLRRCGEGFATAGRRPASDPLPSRAVRCLRAARPCHPRCLHRHARRLLSAPPQRTLRSAAELVAAGLLPPGGARGGGSGRGALRHRRDARRAPPDGPGRPRRPDRAAVPAGRGRTPHRAGRDGRPHGGCAASRPVKGVVHRYPDRALLKPLLACPVYCRFCFRREAVGPGGGTADRGGAGGGARLVRPHAGGAGSDPDRRRPADALAAAPGAHRRAAVGDAAHRDHPPPQPRAGGRPGAGDAGPAARARHRPRALPLRPRQPRARVLGRGAGGARAPASRRRRGPARAERAAARRERQRGGAGSAVPRHAAPRG